MKRLFRTFLFVFLSFAISSYGIAGLSAPESPCSVNIADCASMMMATEAAHTACCDGMNDHTKASLSCKACQVCHTASFIPLTSLHSSFTTWNAQRFLLPPSISFFSQKPSSVWRPPRTA